MSLLQFVLLEILLSAFFAVINENYSLIILYLIGCFFSSLYDKVIS